MDTSGNFTVLWSLVGRRAAFVPGAPWACGPRPRARRCGCAHAASVSLCSRAGCWYSPSLSLCAVRGRRGGGPLRLFGVYMIHTQPAKATTHAIAHAAFLALPQHAGASTSRRSSSSLCVALPPMDSRRSRPRRTQARRPLPILPVVGSPHAPCSVAGPVILRWEVRSIYARQPYYGADGGGGDGGGGL